MDLPANGKMRPLGQGDLSSDWQNCLPTGDELCQRLANSTLNHLKEDQFCQWKANSACNKHKKQHTYQKHI